VPLTASGKLTIVASSDLGGLGSRAGTPTTYEWILPSVAPTFLPWLIVLGLLFLKPNRCVAAWLIWLPIGCVLAFAVTPPSFLPDGTNFFLDVIAALGLGLAAIWLMSGYFPRHHRFLTFLSVLLTLVSFSALAVVLKQGMSLLTVQSLQIGVTLAAGVLASAVALSLAGLACRKSYCPLRLYLWLPLLLAAAWLVIVAPVFVFAQISSGGRLSWSEFFIPILSVAAGNFALFLPFLVLSSASPFFGERLKVLLHVVPAAPPVLPNTCSETLPQTNPQPQEMS
jgi:hypothetical protein